MLPPSLEEERMKVGTEYTVIRALLASSNDEELWLKPGDVVVALEPERALVKRTSAIVRFGRLQAMNPSWYFASGFNFRQPDVTLAELAYEVVRWNEGLQVDLLYDIAVQACPRSVPTYSSFTAALSADKRIAMRDEQGQPVVGVGHNKRFCTYHLKGTMTPVRRTDAHACVRETTISSNSRTLTAPLTAHVASRSAGTCPAVHETR
jgi:hypothetical protein